MRLAAVSLLPLLLLLLVASSEVATAEEPTKSETQKPGRKMHLEVAGFQRSVLQIINGSEQPIDVYWLKSVDERVSNLSVEPGKDSLITTTLGHRFAIIGREDGF